MSTDAPLSETMKRLLTLLKQRGPLSCTQIGEELFADRHRVPRDRQCYARPAGRLVQRAIRLGLVKRAGASETGILHDNGPARYCRTDHPIHPRWSQQT